MSTRWRFPPPSVSTGFLEGFRLQASAGGPEDPAKRICGPWSRLLLKPGAQNPRLGTLSWLCEWVVPALRREICGRPLLALGLELLLGQAFFEDSRHFVRTHIQLLADLFRAQACLMALHESSNAVELRGDFFRAPTLQPSARCGFRRFRVRCRRCRNIRSGPARSRGGASDFSEKLLERRALYGADDVADEGGGQGFEIGLECAHRPDKSAIVADRSIANCFSPLQVQARP